MYNYTTKNRYQIVLVYYNLIIMKKILFIALCLLDHSAFPQQPTVESKEKEQINLLLDAWHKAAAQAKSNDYFDALTENAIFIGTDATEHWDKTAFKAFAKPYFDKGQAWDFKPLERHIYFSNDKNTAWFDELLDTWMKICRGSGVVVKVGNQWKIQHYVLSTTIPNESIDEVVKIKTPTENPLIQKLQTR